MIDHVDFMPIAFFLKIGYGKYGLYNQYHDLKGKFKSKGNPSSDSGSKRPQTSNIGLIPKMIGRSSAEKG
jgi:hypothetical protein